MIFSKLELGLSAVDVGALKGIEVGFSAATGTAGLKSFTAAKAFLNGKNVVSDISRKVSILSAGLVITDIFVNKPNAANVTDLTVSAISIFCPVFGLFYGIADLGVIALSDSHKGISAHARELVEEKK